MEISQRIVLGLLRKMFVNHNVILLVREFMINEARSCSMDFGCITPEYIYRSGGGQVPLNEIEEALMFQDPRFMFQNE